MAGVAAAGVATVGGWLAAVTVTWAVPLTALLVAVTVKGPPTVVAVKSPLALMVPPPETIQLKPGCMVTGLANWSRAVALNCCVLPVVTLAVGGVTTMLVRLW